MTFEIGLRCNREDVIYGDRLHANVITADALPVVVGVNTRAAGQLHIDWYGARSQCAKQERRLRPEQGDDGARAAPKQTTAPKAQSQPKPQGQPKPQSQPKPESKPKPEGKP